MSMERQFSSGVAWMALGGWVEQAANLLIFVVLARILGAQAFGLLAMAAAIVVLSEFLVRETLSEYLIARDAPDRDDLNAVFWLLAWFGGALAVAILAIAPLLAHIYGEPQVAPLIMALSPTVGLVSLTAVPVALLRREMRFRVLALRAIAGVLVGGAIGLGLALAGAGVWALVAQRLALVATNVALAWRATSFRPGRVRPDRQRRRRIMAFGLPVLSLRAAELASVQMPVMLIGALAGPVAAGYYAFSWRLVEAASFLVATPIRMVSQPAFAGLRRAGAGANALLLDLARLASLLAFPAFVGLAALSAPFISVIGGDKWLPAAPVLSALALVGARQVAVHVEQSYCLAHSRIARLSAAAWGEVALGALAILAVSGHGLAAMAWTLTGALYLFWILRIAIVSRIAALPPRRLADCYLPPAALATGMGLVLVWLISGMAGWNPVAILLVGSVTGALLYAILARTFLSDRLVLARRYLSHLRSRRSSDAPAATAPKPPSTPAGDSP